MSQSIKFSGYVLSIIDAKRLCVRVDEEYLDLISSKFSYLCDKTLFKDTINLNVSHAKFRISHKWEELSDLVGVHIKVSATMRRYNYYRKRELFDHNNESKIILVQCKGICTSAQTIKNILN